MHILCILSALCMRVSVCVGGWVCAWVGVCVGVCVRACVCLCVREREKPVNQDT